MIALQQAQTHFAKSKGVDKARVEAISQVGGKWHGGKGTLACAVNAKKPCAVSLVVGLKVGSSLSRCQTTAGGGCGR